MSKSEKNLDNLRHSLAHLLAAAVLDIYPDAKRAIGPAIENGFYYDFEFTSALSDSDLPKIQKQMKKNLNTWKGFEKIEVKKDEALKEFKDNPYKAELVEEFVSEGKDLTIYQSGDYRDLCGGGHVDDIKEINPDAFKLTHIAGAYWRGNEKNTMLTRIYGVAFPTKEELDEHLLQQEEAKKRDHRKLGKELDLFSFSPLVGSGLPLWSPKGTILRTELKKALEDASKKYDVLPVTIPHIAKKDLYDISGHSEKFGDELLKVKSHFGEFVLKPVNCPHHTQIYASKPRSYRDLPVRYTESTMQYRDEQPGEISGLTRVRSITLDDGHTFCRVGQIKEEATNIAKIIEEFYTGLGLYGNHWVSLSVRDPKTPDAYVGEPKDWDEAEKRLQELSDDLKLDAKKVEGEAAIYGPKLDYMFKDALGREYQLATIQIDFSMPKRFKLTYTDKDGSDATPVMIHRAILGSYERFLAILIEHYAGAFPLWLSPVQIKALPIADAHKDYARNVANSLTEAGIRVELDDHDESLGKKIRNAKLEKVPYFLVLGDDEVKGKKVTLESREEAPKEVLSLEKLIEKLKSEIENKK